ncbi:probable vesicular glutamate transporter eat-4 [Ixodes scapularis]|uniref:probable vesicular glutamate transporter eat-4 n=1 Tax=Ixodes scapularis TaxID=6945 RepID=UPI001A9D4289|nr:probable vesicular glutamate transporter eat-4 [Ixodes scapularis]
MYEQRLGKYNYLMYLGDFHRFPSLPSVLALAAVIVTCGVASDFLRDKVLLSTSVARKMSASGGLMIHACAAMLLGLKESHWIEHIAVTALGVFILGIDSNHLDLAPQHAAVLKGVSSTTLWVVVGALNVFIITETSSVMSHRIAHVVLPVCQMVAAMLFLLYGHGRRQEWDLPDLSHADTEVSVSEDVEASEPALDPRSEPGTSDSTERDWPQNRTLQHDA